MALVYSDLWQYFEPIREHMPKNCSADVQRVIAHVDAVAASGDEEQMRVVKDIFGLGPVKHFDDFAAACEFSLTLSDNLLMTEC